MMTLALQMIDSVFKGAPKKVQIGVTGMGIAIFVRSFSIRFSIDFFD